MSDTPPPFREIDFIKFLAALLGTTTSGTIRTEFPIAPSKRVDILIETPTKVTIIEAKGNSPQTRLRIEDAANQILLYGEMAAGGPFSGREQRLILAIPGSLSNENIERLSELGIEVWDGRRIAKMAAQAGIPPEMTRFLEVDTGDADDAPEVNGLAEKLAKTPAGRGSWSPYQRLCREIAEFLFCPPLRSPIWESSNEAEVNKRDFILPNYATGGFWKFLRDEYHADFVVVDAKNYAAGVEKKEVLQIANYLSRHGTGLFALIMTRTDPQDSGAYTIRDQWIQHNKLIVTLNDQEVLQMLTDKSFGNDPSELIRQKIEDFRLGI